MAAAAGCISAARADEVATIHPEESVCLPQLQLCFSLMAGLQYVTIALLQSWQLLPLSTRQRTFFKYEKRIRDLSGPDKIFEYFATETKEDGSRCASRMLSVCPYCLCLCTALHMLCTPILLPVLLELSLASKDAISTSVCLPSLTYDSIDNNAMLHAKRIMDCAQLDTHNQTHIGDQDVCNPERGTITSLSTLLSFANLIILQ